QDHRRRHAGRRLWRPPRADAADRPGRPDLPGRHAQRQPGGDGRGPGHAGTDPGAGLPRATVRRDRAPVRGPGGRRARGRRRRHHQPGRRDVRPVLHRPEGGDLRPGHRLRHRRVQPLLPRHARAWRVPGAERLRSRLRFERARRCGGGSDPGRRARGVPGPGWMSGPQRPDAEVQDSTPAEGASLFEREYRPASTEGARFRWFRRIFHHDAPDERNFDLVLILVILASVVVVLLDSMPSVKARWHAWLYAAEWLFTLAFAFEYGVRLWVVKRPLRYAFSFFGIIDLLA